MAEHRYGFKESSFDQISQLLSIVFNIQWEERSGYFWGDYNLFNPLPFTEVRLVPNWNAEFGDWMEPDHTDYPVVLYISSDNNAIVEEWAAKLVGLKVAATRLE